LEKNRPARPQRTGSNKRKNFSSVEKMLRTRNEKEGGVVSWRERTYREKGDKPTRVKKPNTRGPVNRETTTQLGMKKEKETVSKGSRTLK